MGKIQQLSFDRPLNVANIEGIKATNVIFKEQTNNKTKTPAQNMQKAEVQPNQLRRSTKNKTWLLWKPR